MEDTMKTITFKTATGSIYKVGKDKADQWWYLSANAKETVYSQAVKGQWKIEAPYIKLGEQARMYAPKGLNIGHPDRMPGGGKVTNIVEEILEAK